MSTYIPTSLKSKIEQVDRDRCCYCLTQEANSGISMSFDHIRPQSKGGETTFDNVCLACRSCNEFKSDLIEAEDPLTQSTVLLFHPRQQQWSDHFTWSEDGTKVEGLTDVGRASVLALQMNHPTIVVARRRWVASGWHPPTQEE